MRRRLIGVISGLLVVALSAAAWQAFDDPSYSEPVPSWEPGYTWTYAFVSTITLEFAGSSANGPKADQMKLMVHERVQLEVLDADAEAEGQPAYLVVQERILERITADGETIWPDPADPKKAPLEGLEDACLTVCVEMLHLSKNDLSVLGSGKENAPPAYDFPLTFGKEWVSGTFDAAFEQDEKRFDIRSRAGGEETVTLPHVGPTRAIRIEGSLEPDAARWYDAHAKERSRNGFKLAVDAAVSTTHDYVPAVRFGADSELLFRLTMRMTGEDVRMKSTSTVSTIGVLEDFVLSPKPPRSAEGYLSAGPALPSPPSEPWPFAITSGVSAVDAAAGETVQFHVDGSASSLEDGAVIRWAYLHQGVNGTTRSGAKAETFTATIDEPGLHTVTATVHDREGRLRGTAMHQVDAYSRIPLHLQGPFAVPVLAQGSASDAFPIAPGASALEVTVTPEHVARGSFTIAPVGGTGSPVESNGGQHDLGAPGDPGLYTITWTDVARVGALDLVLTVRYGGPEAGAEDEGEDPRLRTLLDLWQGMRPSAIGMVQDPGLGDPPRHLHLLTELW